MTYNAGSRLVTSVEGAVVSTYTFDANGNQTAANAGGSRTTMAYDYENRMRTAIDPGGARSTLAYWADGMRRFLEVGGTRTTFVWDGNDYLQSRTPSEVTTFSTVRAQILDSETAGSESLLVPDPLGLVVKILDASGNQIYDAEYWPYGEIQDSVGVNDTSWGYVGTWGYHFDTSRRLYVRARVFDPVTGRWYSVDPLWPGENQYVYGNSAPIGSIDFNGMTANCSCPEPRCCDGNGNPVPTPCTDLLGPSDKANSSLLVCLRKAGHDQRAIKKCYKKYRKGLQKNLCAYIGCVSGSTSNQTPFLDPGCGNDDLAKCHANYIADVCKCQFESNWNLLAYDKCMLKAYASAVKCGIEMDPYDGA